MFRPFCMCLLALFMTSSKAPQKWTPLLDKDLSQWESYLGYKHKNGYKGQAMLNENGDTIPPVGYNKNLNNVFKTIQENGKTVLHISGEIYGCVFTKKEYENYHLRLQFKWGSKKWEPRLNDAMDSGILYHSQGRCGVDYWKAWMLSQELQIIEGGIGDYWSIASSQIDIRSEKGNRDFKYNKASPLQSFGEGSGNGNFCQAGENAEKPKGEWNTVELFCFGSKSVYKVNGKVVMALTNSRYLDGSKAKPLTKGRIQLQSEAAEIFFRDVMIKDLKEMPSEYLSLF